jgi:4,5-DOPA dioxygenase extradiol
MNIKSLHNLTSSFGTTNRMPVLFVGHGSPMNAIEENTFSSEWRLLGESLPKPKAIICISAHWETKGTFVTAMQQPPTIHDFGGFPQALFDVQYPAKGHPVLASEIVKEPSSFEILLDNQWGLDHGAWSILKHMYPNADVPVLEMSIDYTKEPGYHYHLAQELAGLRNKGVLIMGSGNMVHNLRMVEWSKLNIENYGFDWAVEANNTMKSSIESFDHKTLVNFQNQGEAFKLAIPTAEHFLPLLYTLGMSDKSDHIRFFNDTAVGGSLTMTSVQFGL